MTIAQQILTHIPNQPPFRFVDEILEVNEAFINGAYRFKTEEFFYTGHFPGHPLTPGVILIECMAQIGLVGLGIYLLMQQTGQKHDLLPVFTSSEADFLRPVYPGERVTVRADKVYFRLNKLKCFATMKNDQNVVVCKGHLSGIIAGNS